jgi:hypothetical protein
MLAALTYALGMTRVPFLSSQLPNVTQPHAGLPMVASSMHSTVFVPNATACSLPHRSGTDCLGTYNHAPQLTRVNQTLISAWHNGEELEDSPGSRVLASTSHDSGHTWSTAQVLFAGLSDPVGAKDLENLTRPLFGTVVYSSGFHRFGPRQYAFASAYNVRCSPQCRASGEPGSVQRRCCEQCLGCCNCPGMKERLPQLIRSVRLGPDSGALSLGPPLWLARQSTLNASYNLSARERSVASYEASTEPMVKEDAREFMEQQVVQRVPAAPSPAQLSERSFWVQEPRHRESNPSSEGIWLAGALRDDGTPSTLREWSSLCQLTGLDERTVDDLTFATARGQHMLVPAGDDPQCNWSTPVPTNIPDSRSSTCAGVLPNRTRYLVGSQLPRLWDRDPITITLSDDGINFDRLLALRSGAPPPVFPAFTKGPGYQYPQAVVTEAGDALITVYSVNKEEIGATRVPLLVSTQRV